MNTQKNFKITFHEAVAYIEDYVSEFKLNDDTRTPDLMNSISGTLKLDLIKEQIDIIVRMMQINKSHGFVEQLRTYQGLMCWFCYSEEQDIGPHYFVAMEANDDVELKSSSPRLRPDMGKQARPFDIVMYNKLEHSNIKNWLLSKSPIVMRYKNEILKGKTDLEGTRNRIQQFIGKIKEPSNIQEPYGLFENELSSDVEEFLIQPNIKYIRYYFGYDPSLSQNKIRIILFGVDKEGNNLVLRDARGNVVGSEIGGEGDPVILQTSWPPWD